jgi:hypothetical protein
VRKDPGIQAKKPFDLLAEGLLQKDSRGDKTAIELFCLDLIGWEVGLRRRLHGRKPL